MLAFTPSPAAAQDLFHLLPDNPPGWSNVDKDKLYTPETLYDYIDGGAELYLSYNMKEVAGRIIANGENEIRIEIFDMQRAPNAFGVFSHTRTKDEKKFGQGSQYFTGALIFWKDRYYIALTANDDNAEIDRALENIGKQIDQKIAGKGKLPAILDMLPVEGLETDGYVYFHHYIWMNSFYYISNENILNISDETDAVLAKYGEKEHRTYLLMIAYPGEQEATEAYNNLQSALFKGHKNPQKIEDKTYIGAIREGAYLIAVFNADSSGDAASLLKSAETKVTNHKTH